MVKQIEIDGKLVSFKASAAIPRIYRIKFGRDIYADLRQLEKATGKDALIHTIGFGNHFFGFPIESDSCVTENTRKSIRVWYSTSRKDFTQIFATAF